eukprot:scaffold73207_cov63-Phaeocystis_antarctica.AAC.1
MAHDLERAEVLDREVGGKSDGGGYRPGGSHHRAVLWREVVGGRVEVSHAAVRVQLNLGRSDGGKEEGDREPLECFGRAGGRAGRWGRGILEQGGDRTNLLGG